MAGEQEYCSLDEFKARPLLAGLSVEVVTELYQRLLRPIRSFFLTYERYMRRGGTTHTDTLDSDTHTVVSRQVSPGESAFRRRSV